MAPRGLPELRKKGAAKKEDIKLTVKLSICYGRRARRQTARPARSRLGSVVIWRTSGDETLALTGFVVSKLLPTPLVRSRQPRPRVHDSVAIRLGKILMKQRLLVSSIIMGLCATLAAGTVFAQDVPDQETTAEQAKKKTRRSSRRSS
jgi:hypothetical protein